MKMSRVNFRNLLSAALVAFVLLTSTTSAVASNENPVVNPVSVKYLGLVNSFPLFRVALQNEDAQSLVITFKDPEGETLYTEKVTGKSYAKKFQFTTTDPESVDLTLYVYSETTKQTQIYHINKVSRIVDDIVIHQVAND